MKESMLLLASIERELFDPDKNSASVPCSPSEIED